MRSTLGQFCPCTCQLLCVVTSRFLGPGTCQLLWVVMSRLLGPGTRQLLCLVTCRLLCVVAWRLRACGHGEARTGAHYPDHVGKRHPVLGAGHMICERRHVAGSGIPLMPGKSVVRVLLVQAPHDLVP